MTQTIDVSIAGLHQVHDRIGQKHLNDTDWPLVGALVSKLIIHEEGKLNRMIAKVEAAAAAASKEPGKSSDIIDVGHKTIGSDEASAQIEQDAPFDPAPNAAGDAISRDEPAGDEETAPPKSIENHGRNGHAAYTSAKHVFHLLTLGILNSLCECGKARLTKYREKIVIRIVGQPLFASEVHHYEQARCKMCGKIIRAVGPLAIFDGFGTNYIVYDWSACAMLSVMHYFGGAPFKRLESLHGSWGTPFSDSNQWNLVDQSDDLLKPLYNALERFGMQNALDLMIDDTGSMIIQLNRQIKAETATLKLLGQSTHDIRTGINATGVRLGTPAGTVILFFTGLHHAGEILDMLLKHRDPNEPRLVKVTDGASKNFNPLQKDRLIEGVCNAHAYLKFYDIKDKHPAEYAIAGEVYKAVFDNDDIAKARGLSTRERMDFHAKTSLPLMEKLKKMCEDLIVRRHAEPNSKLWAPVIFIINQWPRLTRFCYEPGVPLDTNLVEQILITPVRYLSGSFNYQSLNGAEVGDRHMSLIATCRASDAEPVAYLTYCLRNHEDLKKRPEYYFPWAYRDRLKNQPNNPSDIR